MASRFPAPWRIVEIPSGFAVEDACGQQLGVFYGRATQRCRTHRLPDDGRGATDGNRFRKAAGTAQWPRGRVTACLTWAIQGMLGHRSITSTAVYTALAPNRFKDYWRD